MPFSPESTPTQSLAIAPEAEPGQPTITELPVWTESTAAPEVPVFETPVQAEQPKPESLQDRKLPGITVIDAQGTGDSTKLQFGRPGGLYGTEVAQVVEVKRGSGPAAETAPDTVTPVKKRWGKALLSIFAKPKLVENETEK